YRTSRNPATSRRVLVTGNATSLHPNGRWTRQAWSRFRSRGQGLASTLTSIESISSRYGNTQSSNERTNLTTYCLLVLLIPCEALGTIQWHPEGVISSKQYQ